MKRLFLLRHAKAGYAASDKCRPLAARGRADALWLGQYLKKSDLMPDHILCSSALRTKETFTQLERGAERPFSVTYLDDLYLAAAEHIAHLIQQLDQRITAPMIIAHNPGLAILFQALVQNPPKDDRKKIFPTGTLAILGFDISDWSDLESNAGQLLNMILPSDMRKTPD